MEKIKLYPDDVLIGGGRRVVNEVKVEALVESISKIGLQTPITVWFESPDSDRAHLVTGAHRVEACRRLGIDMDAFVTVASEVDRDLWEIDENLCRSELTDAEEAQHLARRKELWAAREVQSAQVEPIESRRTDKRGHRTEGFASETARITGQSKATINRKIARAENIEPDVLEEIKGTELDKGVVLDELAAAPKRDQRAKLAEIALRRQEAERTRKDVEATNRSTDRVIGLSEAQQFADWLMCRTDINELPTIIAWLEGTKPKDVIASMRRMAA